MARYREKSADDLAWNFTRRQITRDLDTKLQNFREDLLNKLLTDAWQKYAEALETGATVQLEDMASGWVDDILRINLAPVLEVKHGDVEDR